MKFIRAAMTEQRCTQQKRLVTEAYFVFRLLE